MRNYVAWWVVLALVAPTTVLADGPAASGSNQAAASTSDATTAPTPEEAATLSDEQALYQENTGVERTNTDTDPHENENEGYYFLGAMYRQFWVPPAFQRLFIDGGIAVFNPGAGLEFTYRKNNFSVGVNVWWQDLNFVGPFRTAGDPAQNTEILDSRWQSVFGAASFLWSTSFNDYVALEYGLDVGFGVLFGDATRTEAYPSNGPGSQNGWAACNGAGDPIGQSQYCAPTTNGQSTDPDGANGEHYNVVARKWFSGGSVPNIVPWLFPRIALRIKPIRQLQVRVDLGALAGVYFGATAAYGF